MKHMEPRAAAEMFAEYMMNYEAERKTEGVVEPKNKDVMDVTRDFVNKNQG